MATDFWASSHYKRWIVDRAALQQARAEDRLYVHDETNLDFLAIFFANVITKLGKKLQLRQRVIATATVFFRRFYFKNPYCETDPFIVIPACVYAAAKAEESSVHIKNVISEAKSLFSQTYGIKHFPSDNSKLAEMEFYLVDDLECDMVVYHPYKTLLALCRKDTTPALFGEEGEEGETDEAAGTGVGAEDGPRYWGTGQGQLVLSESALQTAWSIINDTYRSELCLLFPPHLIAIAAIYLTFILHPAEKTSHRQDDSKSQQPRRSSRQANNNSSNINFSTLATVGHSTNPSFPSASSLSKFKPPPSLPAKPAASFAPPPSSAAPSPSPPSNPDPISFLAQLNVSLPLVATIVQEIISLYTLWDRYKEDGAPEASSHGIAITTLSDAGRKKGKGRSTKPGIPIADSVDDSSEGSSHPSPAPPTAHIITPSFLLEVLTTMRQERMSDLLMGGEGELLGYSASLASLMGIQAAQSRAAAVAKANSEGRQGDEGGVNVNMGYGYPPVNKVLERAMNAGYG